MRFLAFLLLLFVSSRIHEFPVFSCPKRENQKRMVAGGLRAAYRSVRNWTTQPQHTSTTPVSPRLVSALYTIFSLVLTTTSLPIQRTSLSHPPLHPSYRSPNGGSSNHNYNHNPNSRLDSLRPPPNRVHPPKHLHSAHLPPRPPLRLLPASGTIQPLARPLLLSIPIPFRDFRARPRKHLFQHLCPHTRLFQPRTLPLRVRGQNAILQLCPSAEYTRRVLSVRLRQLPLPQIGHDMSVRNAVQLYSRRCQL
jgi:hypothetical protein